MGAAANAAGFLYMHDETRARAGRVEAELNHASPAPAAVRAARRPSGGVQVTYRARRTLSLRTGARSLP